MEEPVTIDVVIPSIRLDAAGMLDALGMDVPHNVRLQYYVVSDNRRMSPGRFVHGKAPVTVIVNEDGLGAPLSRNVGMEAGSGAYILFIDDDVSVPKDLLCSYLAAIRKDPDAPGYIGPTIFPEPVNSFTRGIAASGMLTFFELPSDENRLLSWGTTSNLMLRRSSVGGVRFSPKFPKHGGGEDVDFCIQIAAGSKKLFRTVPAAAARHPWWKNGGRSYTRFFRWAFGDSLMVRRRPEYAYYDAPDIVESMIIGGAVLASLALMGAIPPAMIAVWAGLSVCSEFLVERFQVTSHHPKSSVLASLEAAPIRISSQLGRFFGPLSRKSLPNLCRRFDYITTGEWKGSERRFAAAKFALFAASIPASYWLCMWLPP